jgi:hypothetical protein
MNNKDELLETAASSVTSVAPTASARVRLSPIDARGVVIEDGFLADRQRLNREVTLLHGAEQLEQAGTLENFRIAAGRASGERKGMVFSDSDVYKWLEAAAWELERKPSAELQRVAEETIALVAAAQEADGYINTWCQVKDPSWRWTDLAMGHELYCAGHLFQAGVAFARATGDTRLLTVSCNFADLIEQLFDEGPQTGTDGHPEVSSHWSSCFAKRVEVAICAWPIRWCRAAGMGSSRTEPSTLTTTRIRNRCVTQAHWSGMPCARCTSPPG